MAVTDTDYAATWDMTALASQGSGLSANGMRQKDLVATLTEVEANWNGILAKLDADGGVNDTDYAANGAVDLNNTVVGSLGLGQDDYVSLLDSFITNFNTILTQIDSDSGVADTDYSATLIITDVVNSGSVVDRNTAVKNAGTSQIALFALLSTVVTQVAALNAKLDADEA